MASRAPEQEAAYFVCALEEEGLEIHAYSQMDPGKRARSAGGSLRGLRRTPRRLEAVRMRIRISLIAIR